MTTAQSIESPSPALTKTAMTQPAILTAGERHQPARWLPGQRLHQLFESRCDALACEGNTEQPALELNGWIISYCELDRQANQLARYLLAMGFCSGDRLGLLFDKSASGYIAEIATLNMGAVYVPLDANFPTERIQYIIDDAQLAAILSVSTLSTRDNITGTFTNSAAIDSHCLGVEGQALSVPTIDIDTIRPVCDEQASDRLPTVFADSKSDEEVTDNPFDDADTLAYIIYTSGSIGKPKGVPILHSSICNFVTVAAQCYAHTPQDRVYQGLSIAFDFAVEEFWVPLVVGSTLVPNTSGAQRLGDELRSFLIDRHISALCCLQTLLATIEGDIPELRLLIVSGEACQQDIVQRWYSPNRTILNAYGPTETTVTATVARLEPGRAVTIGQPLPTYTIVILDPEHDQLLEYGETGEIGIAGIGLSPGYLNRHELNDRVFINDFIGLPHNPGGRIYRSGDLGYLTQEHQLAYQGRIDTQVKMRGYRIELSEIESAIMQQTDIAHAVVNTHESQPGSVELAAYCTRADASVALAPSSWLQ